MDSRLAGHGPDIHASPAPPPWQAPSDAALSALDDRRVASAARLFRRAEALGMPDLAAVEPRWRTAMLLGRYDGAWALSDAVLASRAPDDFNRPWTPYHTRCVWDGSPLAGRRVLVRCYHGLGDTIQFIRYAGPLKAMGCTVLVEAQAELLPLVRGCAGVDAAVPLGEADAAFTWDVQAESMELSHALRTMPDSIPGPFPYLCRDLPRTRGGTPRVGLVWQAGGWDGRRSLDLAALGPLLAVPGVEFVSLQPGQDRGRLAEAGLRDGAVPGIDELAVVMCGLDLVVTVDTMAAHLAGALAVPGLVLLHRDADWRWGAKGQRTPWYPSLRLLRQRAQGDWGPVAAQAAEAVAALAQPSLR